VKLPFQHKIDDGVFSAIGLMMVASNSIHYSLSLQLLRVVAPDGGAKNAINAVTITLGMKVDTLLGLVHATAIAHRPSECRFARPARPYEENDRRVAESFDKAPSNEAFVQANPQIATWQLGIHYPAIRNQ